MNNNKTKPTWHFCIDDTDDIYVSAHLYEGDDESDELVAACYYHAGEVTVEFLEDGLTPNNIAWPEEADFEDYIAAVRD